MADNITSDLRGRVTAIEAILAAIVADRVAEAAEPIDTAVKLLGRASGLLQQAADTAPTRRKRQAVRAIESFDDIFTDVLAYVAHRADQRRMQEKRAREMAELTGSEPTAGGGPDPAFRTDARARQGREPSAANGNSGE